MRKVSVFLALIFLSQTTGLPCALAHHDEGHGDTAMVMGIGAGVGTALVGSIIALVRHNKKKERQEWKRDLETANGQRAQDGLQPLDYCSETLKQHPSWARQEGC